MIRAAILSLTFVALIAGCSDPYPSYSKLDDNLYYSIRIMGEGEQMLDTSHYIVASYSLSTMQDSVFFRSRIGRTLEESVKRFSSFPEALRPGLMKLLAGDSASFIIQAASMRSDSALKVPSYLGADDVLKAEVIIRNAYSQQQFDSLLVLERRRIQMLIEQEFTDLKAYLDRNNITPQEYYHQGIYFIPLEEGEGELPRVGDDISLNYIGRFVDSALFDNTYLGGIPLEFKLGDPEQVIPGIDVGVRLMKPGGKARLIIPFDMGFGTRGSEAGIVPACKTLIYDAELTHVSRAAL